GVVQPRGPVAVGLRLGGRATVAGDPRSSAPAAAVSAVPALHTPGTTTTPACVSAGQGPFRVAPATGFEPVTARLTVGCSAVELRGIARSILAAIGSADDPLAGHESSPAEARTRSSSALARRSTSAGGFAVPETVTWENSDPSG